MFRLQQFGVAVEEKDSGRIGIHLLDKRRIVGIGRRDQRSPRSPASFFSTVSVYRSRASGALSHGLGSFCR